MNREQQRIFELMKEFDEFCSKNEIKYCLSGESLLYGFSLGTIEPKPCNGSVIMTAANCKKFIEAFESEKPEGREIEYWGNSKNYPDYSVRYVNSNTTSFNILDFLNYQTHGMFIEIQILRNNKRKKADRTFRAIEKGITFNSYNDSVHLTKIKRKKDKLSNAYYKGMCILKGKARVRKQLFEHIMTSNSKPDSMGKGVAGVYKFTNRNKVIKDVSQYYFDKLDTCEIEGYSFPIPSNTRAFLKKVFAGRYSYGVDGDKVSNNFRYTDNCIVDADVPYAESIKNMDINKSEILELIKSKERIEEINKLNKSNNTLVRGDWLTVLQTDARFRMWKHYMPLKDEILGLYKAEDWDKLEEIFEDYTSELSELRDKKRSFSFDNDILKIYIQLLEYRGNFEEADRIYSQLPKSHFEPICIDTEEEK